MKTISVADLRGKLGLKVSGGTARPMLAKQFAATLQTEHASDLERAFGLRWRSMFPDLEFETEFTFHEIRKFRFDFAFVAQRVGVELNGGIWACGESGHSSGTGISRDYEKNNLAISQDWIVFQLSEAMARDQTQLRQIAATVRARSR